MSTNDDLRARLAFLEQELKNKIARVTQTSTTKVRHMTGAKQITEQSNGSLTKKSSPNQLLVKNSSKPIQKNFKWTAPKQDKSTNLVTHALKSHNPTSSPPAADALKSHAHPLVTKQSSRSDNSIADTTSIRATGLLSGTSSSSTSNNGPNGSKNSSTQAQAPPNISLLLAKIRMINEEASLMYKNLSINNTSSTPSSMKSPLRNTLVAKKSKKKKSDVKASRLLHKWTSSSVSSATKPANRRKSASTKATNIDKGRRDSTGKGKKKKSWRKEDGDFIFVPIATHQYCMFFNKLGSCRSGSNW